MLAPASAVPEAATLVWLAALAGLVTLLMASAGGTVSMVTLRAAEAGETLPAMSVAVAVMAWVPSLRAELIMLQLPSLAAVAVPRIVLPSSRVTVMPASAVPVKAGVGTLVRFSPGT